MRCQLIIGLFLLINSVNTSLNAQSSKLDLEQIMTGKDFTGYWPENHFWLPNGNILFSWNPENNLKSSNYLASEGTVSKVKLNKLSTFPSRNMVKHSSNSFYAYIKNGRIFKWESSLNNPKLIYQTYDNIYSVQLVKDSNKIYFVKNSTLCKINTLNCNYSEVLKFKMSTVKPSKSKQETYLKNQQLELFNFHKKSLLTKNDNENFNDSVNYWKRKPVEFKSGKIEDIFISADESSVIYIHKENNKTKKTHVWTKDKKYLDMMCYVGQNTLGYNHSDIDSEVIKKIKLGNMSTLNSPEEVELAEELLKIHNWANMVKFARSGGEANAMAIRIARAASRKDNVAICGYHGWHDWYLSVNLKNKNDLNDHLLPGLKPIGVPKKLMNTTHAFNYGDINQVYRIIKKYDVGRSLS